MQMPEDSNKKQNLITGDIMIEELITDYPQVIDFLIIEYGFHCVNCFVSGFEKLEEGAKVHGISGPHFEELLDNLNKLVNGELGGDWY